MKYKNLKNNILINEVIELEYEMFDKVNGIDGRASCQDNYKTFYVMRYSQHQALSKETIKSYLEDLKEAKLQNRNLITEKYAYMMEITDNEYYKNNLEKNLPYCSNEKIILINQILELLDEDYLKFEKKYPKLASRIRPKNDKNTTTIDIYMMGELKTYSKRTLEKYISDIIIMKINGQNFIEKIQRETISFYGYKNIEEAENK